MEIFAETGCRATFFVLGWLAHREPELIREIAAAGHEIGSHGYRHRLVYRQTEKQFTRDIRISKDLLENLIGSPVVGYRAPNFSITERTPWAYNALIEAGYRYDSSVHPIRHPRYGNRHRSAAPEILVQTSGCLAEIPLSVVQIGEQLQLPISGGAYWRLFPMSYLRWGMQHSALSRNLSCYLHPWELDPNQPRYRDLSVITQLRHYGGSAGMANRTREFCERYHFVSIAEAFADVISGSNVAHG